MYEVNLASGVRMTASAGGVAVSSGAPSNDVVDVVSAHFSDLERLEHELGMLGESIVGWGKLG